MGLLTVNSLWAIKPSNLLSLTYLACRPSSFTCGRFSSSYNSSKLRFALARVYSIRAFAKQKSSKKLRRQNEAQKDLTSQLNRGSNDDYSGMEDRSSPGIDDFQDSNKESSFEKFDSRSSIYIPSRSAVLQACTVTSSLIAALGVVIRQVSHVASTEGWPIHDCSTEVPFVSFEMWHLQLVTGIVIVVSSCRYLLLKTWPDFAESTEAANRQVLTSLQPLDYTVVAFLPGVSEELFFRGALLPLFGINWISILLVAALFGVLHLGSGRKYSFAIWATFVGFAYGYATILSSNLLVPMACHATNNLVGGLVWRYTSKLSK
ncbi:uncharacterized protein LOC127809765 isoform X2 [Diospyros lotus]|uniref:uncharacterized protein LOC127809765 isoform X2 n=2 Tax=Diospyros lotus TaxID=55363 RepID=UPI0022561268|nr:uncharacterized protein LOC127809765 isoform X2 [Diospyros lotus]